MRVLIVTMSMLACTPKAPPEDTSEDTSEETGTTGTDECVEDADCEKVYSDCSYCNCEAVPEDEAWTMAELDCEDYTGAVCDYDCVWSETEWAECQDGRCVLVIE